ncbi:MAG: hypothetical protein LBQ94_04615 [Treponema sp.]|nr:hypothetical protein [Treponema sp.]
MKVIRAGIPGFCEGVRRAVGMALGLSAGASTPDSQIDEAEKALTQ